MAFSLSGGLTDKPNNSGTNPWKDSSNASQFNLMQDSPANASVGMTESEGIASKGAATPTSGQAGSTTYADTTTPGTVGATTPGTSATAPGTTNTTNGAINPTVAGVGVGPETGQVTSDMLVEDRLNRLLKNGSPYIEQASARARQLANSRGMANSSLSGQAGEEGHEGGEGRPAPSAAPAFDQGVQTHRRLDSTILPLARVSAM